MPRITPPFYLKRLTFSTVLKEVPAIESTEGGAIKRISRVADSNIVTTFGIASFRLFRMAPPEGIIMLEHGA
jgi:hypothetical protein